MLDIALRYARLGYAVFPVRSDKTPLTRHGCLDASTDPSTVYRMFSRRPNAWIGVATGRASDMVVLDVDAHKGGYESLADLEAAYGRFPATLTQRTPRGGAHYLFTYPESIERVPNSVDKVGTALDIRGDSGYIVAAPSGAYRRTSAPGTRPAPMPDWLLGLALAGSTVRVPAPAGGLIAGAPNPRDYVPLITGADIDSRGFALCPHPTHDDHEPTLKVWPDSVTCFRCEIKTRERGLAAMKLGIGTKDGWRLELTDDEKTQADALLVGLGVL